MSDTADPPHRAYYQPDPALVEYREVDDQSDDGLMAVRMPIASTGVVRNEGDDPLTRDELAGMARQINDRDVGVFLAHGQSFEITDARYGQTERLGSWREAELDDERAADDSTLLMATAVMADPETLPAATGRYREALAIIKEQAKRDIPLSASIGWREDADSPGGNDLMEASIVGIPADPRTVAQGATVEAMARAAVEAGADPEAFVESVRTAVMEPDGREPDTDADMSDDTTDADPEPDAEQEADGEGEATDTEESNERQEAPEWAERLLENQQSMIDGLNTIAEAVRQDDEDEDEDDEDMDDNESDDEDDEDEENAADAPDEEQEAEADSDADDTDSEAERKVAEYRKQLDAMREDGIDVSDVQLPEPAEGDEERDADTDDTDPGEDDLKRVLRN